MPTSVHVIVSGIVTLIPNTDDDQPTGWTVRLQDARHHAHHPHLPSIVAEKDRLVGVSRPADRSLAMDDGTELGGWFLGSGGIRITNRIVSNPIQSPRPLPWVLRLADVDDGTNDDYATVEAGPNGVELNVESGSLDATLLEPEVWRFDSKTAAAARWIAEEVCWSFAIEEDALEIILPDARGELAMKIGAADGRIELRLQNMLEEDIFPEFGDKPEVDEHVKLYFEQTVAAPDPIPDLKQEKPPGEVPEIDGHDHRLADYVIALNSTGGGPGLRVNCPPAQPKKTTKS